MTELSGFSPISKLDPVDVAPQSLRVPVDKAGAVDEAATILSALWDAVDAGLSPNIKVEILRRNPPDGDPVTMCRITPVRPDGVASSVANPGDWLAADSSGVRGMTNDVYASQFTQNMPIEWTATATAPVASIGTDGKAVLTFPQPTSANRPFAYAVKQHESGDAVGVVGDPSVVDGAVTLALDFAPTADAVSFVVHVDATDYAGVEADSLASNTVTAPAVETPAG